MLTKRVSLAHRKPHLVRCQFQNDSFGNQLEYYNKWIFSIHLKIYFQTENIFEFFSIVGYETYFVTFLLRCSIIQQKKCVI